LAAVSNAEKKYFLYEASVQEASDDAEILEILYRRLRKKRPYTLREDFCGTFKMASEWVKRSPKHKAIGLDIDPEPLAFGKKHHWRALSRDQRSRLRPLKKNVMTVTKPAVDIVAACNFSYWIFKEREVLTRYFRSVYKSLKKDGLFFLDMVGGSEMLEEHEDKEKYRFEKERFTYVWRCESYNPVSNEGFYSISFEFPGGKVWKRAFTYDWRVWSIREIRECLKDAGFKASYVLWEGDDEKGQGTGEFHITEKEENSAVWISYVVGAKS